MTGRALAVVPLVTALAAFSCGAGSAPEEGRAEIYGAPSGRNRLGGESSPYLLLHAENPVDWYPWGEEALAKARSEDKPIFLSVGYSTCYWCHVMEREVFSDPAIAALMNRWFVSIKVDREERPDLDEIYMTATQMLTGSGGWPNSVFLTPGLEPFFAGTYFPPEDRFGRPAFPAVLARIEEAWRQERQRVGEVAREVAGRMRWAIAEQVAPAATVPASVAAATAVEALAARYDERWGGFGAAPKFPAPGRLLLLWEAGRAGSQEHEMVLETLRRMGRGGIYDQVGGGFHRYSTDERWLVPHFEKMLYDNAHLAELLALAWQETGDPEFERLARGTLDFVLAELTLPEGGFKSAIDAQTDGEEGAYYVWSTGELRAALGEEGFALLAPIYGFDGAPNFEGDRYVLHLTAPLAEHAERSGIDRDALLVRLAPELAKLAAARGRRERPLVDDKVLTDWNAMMIAAMARGGAVLGEPRYHQAAERAASFLLAELWPQEGTLQHAWRGGEAKIDAFLDDYAFLLRGLLALGDTDDDRRWLAAAERLAEELERRLAAPQGGYHLAAADPQLLFQPLSATDGAIPGGNSVAILGLLDLAERTGKAVYRERAERALRGFASALERYPAAVPTLAAALLRYHGGGTRGGPRVAAAPARPSAAAELERLARDVVAATARAEGDGAWRSLTVQLEIQPGWHVNANPASLDFLVPTTVAGPVRALEYPRGETIRFAFAAEELSVYAGTVSLGGEVEAGAGSVRLTYQACDDQRCLPPVTETLPVAAARRQ